MRPWHVPTPSTPRCRRCRPPYVALNLSAYAPPRCACRQAPAILRLVFHDAGTWDPDTRTGGPNGSIRLELDRPMRLVGLAAFDLLEPGQAGQGDLFASGDGEARSERASRVEHAVDSLRQRFGDVVTRAGRIPRDRSGGA